MVLWCSSCWKNLICWIILNLCSSLSASVMRPSPLWSLQHDRLFSIKSWDLMKCVGGLSTSILLGEMDIASRQHKVWPLRNGLVGIQSNKEIISCKWRSTSYHFILLDLNTNQMEAIRNNFLWEVGGKVVNLDLCNSIPNEIRYRHISLYYSQAGKIQIHGAFRHSCQPTGKPSQFPPVN